MTTIQEKVAEKIQNCGEFVTNTVVDKLADVEIARRVDLVTKAIQRLDTLEKELKKIDKNDITTYQDGKEIQTMSKARFDEIKKTKEKIEKLTKAIEVSLTENTADSYTKLKNATGDQKESATESAE